MKKIISILLLAVFPFSIFAGDVITVKGSDTMVILAQRWAEVYMKNNPNVTLQITGGGSGTGISALINGTTDIANASRPMKLAEKQKLKLRYSTLGVEIKTAKDGIAIYVNEKNPVKELTLAQIKAIYIGKITNWKEVGGSDARIILYSRENNSGTYVYFKENVLDDEDYALNCQNMPGTAALVNAISKDPNGVGYGGSAYGKGIRELMVKQEDGSPAYYPNMENVESGKYPITRFLYMYVKSKPTGAMKEYIDWILSDEGQELVKKVGYFPLK